MQDLTARRTAASPFLGHRDQFPARLYARRQARVSAAGDLVLLGDHDRSRWDTVRIAAGEMLVEQALSCGTPGPYQLNAAIAACHSGARSAADTDWRQIAALYGVLARYEPTLVVGASRAVAVAMTEGPAAGLAILDTVGADPRLDGWPQLHIARAELQRQLGRPEEAPAAYRAAASVACRRAGIH
jgi:RNA polymerase sigma-70 factor (ECF subfamily)